MSEENKAIVRRYVEELDRRKGPAEELCAPNFTAHVPGSPAMDLLSFKEVIGGFYTAFPNLTHTIEDLVSEGDKVAMRATMNLARRRPERITLELSDSLFVVIQSPGGRAAVPMNGDEIELNRSEWPTKVKVQWDGREPSFERALEDGGKIVDRFELVSRDRLIVTREFEVGPMGKTTVRFAYDREGGDSRPPIHLR